MQVRFWGKELQRTMQMYMTHISPTWQKRGRQHRGCKRITQQEWLDRQESGAHTPEKQQEGEKVGLKAFEFIQLRNTGDDPQASASEQADVSI